MGEESISQSTLVDLFGQEQAAKILEACGGWSVCVPVEHDMLKALGPVLFGEMVRHFGGRDIALPDPPRNAKKERVIELLEQGVPVREITRRLNVTGRWVQMVKRQLRKTGEPPFCCGRRTKGGEE